MGMFSNAFSKKNRALLHELVKTDFKLRYQGSAIGYAWSLLKPLFMFAILYVVFTMIFPLGKDIPHYPVYLFTGMMLWTLFADMTQQSIGSIVGRGDLIRKIKIPRWMIVVATSLNVLINLALNMVVLIIFMVLNHVEPMMTLAWFPLVILQVYVLALGCSFLLSAAYVKYRDIQYIWEVLLQAGFYLTPILYPLTLVGNHLFRQLIFLNPMAQAIQDARWAIVSHDPRVITAWQTFPSGWYVLIPIGLSVLLLVAGIAYFRSQQNSFAENI
jgi:ABC-2 type transport system permease protein